MLGITSIDVVNALRNTSKGRLKYDRYWMEEGRTKEILDSVSEYSTNVSINVSPKILSVISSESCKEDENKEKSKSVSSEHSIKKSPNKNDNDTYFYELQSEMELPILEYEEERLKYLQEIFESKKNEYEHYSQELQQQTEQEYQLLKRKNELDAKRRDGDLKKIEETIMKEAKEKEHLQREHYQTQAKKLSAKVLEAEMKQKKAEEELRKKEQEQKEFRMQLSNCQTEAQNVVYKSIEKLNSCEHPTYLRVPVDVRVSQMRKWLQTINEFVESKVQELTIDDVLNANFIVKQTCEYLQDITNDIELAKVKALHEHEVQVPKFLNKDISVPQKENSKSSVNSSMETGGINIKSPEKKRENNVEQTTKVATLKDRTSDDRKKLLSVFIAPDAVDEYYNIMENLKKVTSIIQSFIADIKNKKYRFELQKSVNVPINAVSSVSGSHVKDKISRLLAVLSNKTDIHKNEKSSNSVVYNFCAQLVAKQFVEQADKQISAQYSTAFPIALAIIGVWMKKPEVGQLIRGHFYSNCPYLVPFYPPRKEDQSEQEYHKILGYHFDKEGNMEEKYKFLNRMSGYMRLYAAIVQSPIPPNSNSAHPHGIAWGWRWLSRILNMDPRPDITATLLYDFLEVAGYALQKTYGKQFKKMLHILCKDYFQKIKRVTPGGSGGPVERLETFLQQTVKKGYIPRPEGVLDSVFWNS